MKISTRILFRAFISLLFLSFCRQAFADVITSSSPVAASNLQQGSTTQVISITKMDVSALDATVNTLQVTLSGTFDNNDIVNVGLWLNATAASISGASNLSNLSGSFAAPHTYTFNISTALVAGTSGYFIITVNLSNTATHNHTIKVNTGTNPIIFGFTAPQTYTNNQTDVAGIQTIQAADVTVSSVAIPVATLQQGATTQMISVTKLDVSTQPVSINSVQVTLTGTHDNNDITNVGLWFNATAPSLTGAINLSNLSGAFAGPHTYTFSTSRAMAAGSSGYFIITVNVSNAATHNNTIKVDAVTNPVILGFPTAPNYTNTQTDVAGLQTIQAADVAVSSIAVPAANLQQGSTTQPVYITKLDVSTQPITVNSVQVTLLGTQDNNDISNVGLWFNPTAPTLSGATNLSNLAGTFAAPHTYTFSISSALTAGSSGYFIITTNILNTATHNNTIKVNGASSPAVIGFTTQPNYTNSQTDVAGVQTIQAANVLVTTSPVAAAVIAPGATNQVVYIAQANATTQAVVVNSIRATLSGTHDNNDLTNVGIWFNATAPSLSGASNLSNLSGAFAAPHTYTFNLSSPLPAGTTGYYIITVNASSGATIGNTVHVNGATDPLLFGFTTAPNYTNAQTDDAGTLVLPVKLISFNAKQQGEKVLVQWVTASEPGGAYFEVEHSRDGTTFFSLGKINSKGTNTTGNTYGFANAQPASGNNYYRLKQVDINNRITYSQVVSVLITYQGNVVGSVYPNPVITVAKFVIDAKENDRFIIRITNQAGRVVLGNMQQVIKGTNNVRVDLSRLSAGSYSMQVYDSLAGIISIQKIILQH